MVRFFISVFGTSGAGFAFEGVFNWGGALNDERAFPARLPQFECQQMVGVLQPMPAAA